LEMLARAPGILGQALSLQTFAESAWQNSATLCGVMELPGNPSADALRRMETWFAGRYAGTDNAGKPLYVDPGTKWTAISVARLTPSCSVRAGSAFPKWLDCSVSRTAVADARGRTAGQSHAMRGDLPPALLGADRRRPRGRVLRRAAARPVSRPRHAGATSRRLFGYGGCASGSRAVRYCHTPNDVRGALGSSRILSATTLASVVPAADMAFR
jgi:hypothetical protein